MATTTTTQSWKELTTCLIGGGLAGTSVDIALYPLDTIKTRMQASQGFFKAGGLRGMVKQTSHSTVSNLILQEFIAACLLLLLVLPLALRFFLGRTN